MTIMRLRGDKKGKSASWPLDVLRRRIFLRLVAGDEPLPAAEKGDDGDEDDDAEDGGAEDLGETVGSVRHGNGALRVHRAHPSGIVLGERRGGEREQKSRVHHPYRTPRFLRV